MQNQRNPNLPISSLNRFFFLALCPNLIMILHLYDFKSNSVCGKARKFICLFIVRTDVAANQIMVCRNAPSALRKNMIHIPSELAVTVIVSSLGDGSSGKIHCLRILTKGLVPKPHGGFSIQVHRLLFALSHILYIRKDVNCLL